jgi:plastocyanin
MKRFSALIAVLLALGLLLAACGSDDDPSVEGGADMTEPMDDEGMMDDGDMGDGHDESSDVADDARRIEVTATSFEFDPDEIRVDAGENIAIVLTSEDILHDFTIEELGAHVSADQGETEEGGFMADEPGRYTYYCTVTGHREAGMEGTLIVE